MDMRRLDPDTITEEERVSLREQIKRLLQLAKRRSEDPLLEGSTLEEMSQAFFSSKESADRSFKEEEGKVLDLLRKAVERDEHATRLSVTVGKEEVDMPLPRHFTTLILELLAEVAQGHSVSVSAEDEELTTSEAAELLNVSRPHLVKLLEEGKIPFRKVGTHRRVRRKDVLRYKQKQREEAEEAMQNLTDQAQELGLGY